MNTITIQIDGKPVAKGRPRVGKNGNVFTPAKTRNWESAAKYFAAQEMAHKKPFTGPVSVFVLCTFAIPSSWPHWKQSKAVAGEIGHTAKPDLDNVAKASCDAMNGIVFLDDAQITTLSVNKRYAKSPSVKIVITELDLMSAQQKRKPREIPKKEKQCQP